jgi:hypothetical protein
MTNTSKILAVVISIAVAGAAIWVWKKKEKDDMSEPIIIKS